MENRIKEAVILVAGLGSRLKPLTDEVPKCLTEVNGKPILVQTIESLEKHGIQEAAIVVGYLGQSVIEKLGHRHRNMSLTYIWNRAYDETNSMYSAWLARDYLERGAFLIEGDTVFEEALIKQAIDADDQNACWILDRFTPDHDGSMSIADESGRIVDLKIVRGKLKDYRPNYYKSTGIVKITAEYGKLFARWLDEEVAAGNVQIYYDLVIAKHLGDAAILVCDVTGREWIEIDSLDDLKRAEEIFRPTKYVIVVIDGAGDLPVLELGDRTPLECAHIPHIDAIALQGHTGLMRTMYPGLPLGSAVGCLGIMGYNPMRYYPNGRASFEALAQDIYLEEDEIAFRCNLVSISDGVLSDFTAANIPDGKARDIVQNLSYDGSRLTLYPGQSYRNLLILKAAQCNPGDLCCFEPHMNIGTNIEDLVIQGGKGPSTVAADRLNDFMRRSVLQLRELNLKLGTSAHMLFPWSPSSEPRMPSFQRKYGLDGAVISGLDFLRGIAIAARMEARKVAGATGYSDTDLSSKLAYTVNSLRYNDVVFLHINAPDEESHNKRTRGKINILERIDKEVMGPLKEHLDGNYSGRYRLAILPDHYTLVDDGKHTDHLVPYAVCGEGIRRDDVASYSEKTVAKKSVSIIKSYEFLDFLIENPGE